MLNEQKTKTFWQKPEGIPGAIILSAIIGGIGIGLYKIMPYIVELLQNTLYACGLAAILGIILYCVFDPHIRAVVWLKFKAIMRSLTGLVINLDPIGIMKAYIQTLREKRETMDQHLTLLNGELKKIEREIYSNENQINSKLKEGNAAEKQLQQTNDETEALRLKGSRNLATREAARLKDSNTKLQPMLQQLQVLYRMINKLFINSEFLIADMDSEVKTKEREYKSIKEASKAVNAAKSIFGSSSAELDIFNQSVEALQEDIGNRVGAITRFMENTQSVLTNIDVKNGMLEEEGLKMLEEFNDNNFSLIFDSKLGIKKEEAILLPNESLKTQSKFQNLLK